MTGDELLDDREIAALRAELERRAAEIDVPAGLRVGVDRRHRRLRRRRAAARAALRAAIVVVVAAVAVGGWWATDERDHEPGSFVQLDRAGDGAVPSDAECETLVGPEPWVTLFEAEPTAPCVIVGDFQDVQVWNKGFDTITVEWADGPHRLAPDESFATGPIGEVLDPGDHTFESSPYAMPTIRLVSPDDSPTAGIEPAGETFGPVAPGATVDEAEAALGVSIVPSDLFPGGCAHVVRGDPYSPTFLVTDPQGSRQITDIVHRDEPVRAYTCGRLEGSGSVVVAPQTVPGDVDAMFSSLMIDSIDGAPDLPLADDAVLLIGDQHRQPLEDSAEPSAWIADVEDFNGASGPIDVLDALDGLRRPTTVVAEGPVARCGAGDPLPAPDLEVEVTAWALYPIDVDSCLQWLSIELFVDTDGRVAAVRYDHWEP